MTPNPRRMRERLQREVYDLIPAVACKELCQDQCSVIPCSVVERDAVQRASGRPLEFVEDMRCSMLTGEGRCAVHDARPTICRLYGAADGLLCPHGCTPERVLTREEASMLLARADEIGGVPGTRRAEIDMLKLYMTYVAGRGK